MNATPLLALAEKTKEALLHHHKTTARRQRSTLCVKNKVGNFAYDPKTGHINLGWQTFYTTREEWDYGDRFNLIKTSIEVLPEFGRCREAIKKFYKLTDAVVDQHLGQLLFYLVSRLDADQTISVADVVMAFVRDLDSAPVLWQVRAELIGIFLPDDRPLEFKELVLRRPAIADFEIERPMRDIFPPETHLSLPPAYLEFSVRAVEQTESQKQLSLLVDLFRLFKLGGVCSGVVSTTTPSILRHTGVFWGNLTRQHPPFTYPLTEADIQPFDAFCAAIGPELKELKSTPATAEARERLLSTAFSRYKDALGAVASFEERLTRAVTCLEALFLKGEERSELTHKLSQRVSYLMKFYGFRSLEVYQNIQAAYDMRSSYVHGSEVSAEDKNRYQHLPRKILEVSRLSLLVFLQLKKSVTKDSFIGKIDNALLDSDAAAKFAELVQTVPKPHAINLK